MGIFLNTVYNLKIISRDISYVCSFHPVLSSLTSLEFEDEFC